MYNNFVTNHNSNKSSIFSKCKVKYKKFKNLVYSNKMRIKNEFIKSKNINSIIENANTNNKIDLDTESGPLNYNKSKSLAEKSRINLEINNLMTPTIKYYIYKENLMYKFVNGYKSMYTNEGKANPTIQNKENCIKLKIMSNKMSKRNHRVLEINSYYMKKYDNIVNNVKNYPYYNININCTFCKPNLLELYDVNVINCVKFQTSNNLFGPNKGNFSVNIVNQNHKVFICNLILFQVNNGKIYYNLFYLMYLHFIISKIFMILCYQIKMRKLLKYCKAFNKTIINNSKICINVSRIYYCWINLLEDQIMKFIYLYVLNNIVICHIIYYLNSKKYDNQNIFVNLNRDHSNVQLKNVILEEFEGMQCLNNVIYFFIILARVFLYLIVPIFSLIIAPMAIGDSISQVSADKQGLCHNLHTKLLNSRNNTQQCREQDNNGFIAANNKENIRKLFKLQLAQHRKNKRFK